MGSPEERFHYARCKIRDISGSAAEALAKKLGVTFAPTKRWLR